MKIHAFISCGSIEGAADSPPETKGTGAYKFFNPDFANRVRIPILLIASPEDGDPPNVPLTISIEAGGGELQRSKLTMVFLDDDLAKITAIVMTPKFPLPMKATAVLRLDGQQKLAEWPLEVV